MIDSTCIVGPRWKHNAASAYLEAAAWADVPEDEPMFDGASWSKRAYVIALNVVDRFVDRCAVENVDLSALDASQCGHDLWLTRKRHGAGFWDRGMSELGDRLTKIAHTFSEHVCLDVENGELTFSEEC